MTPDILQHQGQFLQFLANGGKAKNTIKNYKTDLDCFNEYLRQRQHNLMLADLSSPEINDYHAYLQQRYQSDNSRRRRVQTLRVFFDYLMRQNAYPTNPIRAIPTSPKFLDIPRPTSFEDIKTLWQFLLQNGKIEHEWAHLLALRNQLIFLLIFGAGMKVAEISMLPQDHILRDGTLRVLVSPPRRDPYTIPLPEIFASILDEYLAYLNKRKADLKATFKELLFSANAYQIIAGGLTPRGIEILFEDFRKKLAIGLTPKSLRQACVYKWLQQGVAENTIKEWLGLAPSYCLTLYKRNPVGEYHEEVITEMYKAAQSAHPLN